MLSCYTEMGAFTSVPWSAAPSGSASPRENVERERRHLSTLLHLGWRLSQKMFQPEDHTSSRCALKSPPNKYLPSSPVLLLGPCCVCLFPLAERPRGCNSLPRPDACLTIFHDVCSSCQGAKVAAVISYTLFVGS